MFKIVKLVKITALILVMGLFSCNKYQKLLKSTDYELKHKKAIEYYEKEDYIKAQALFEELQSIYRGTAKAQDVYFYYANCFYHTHDYIMASYHFSVFAEMFPNHKNAEEAQYLSAYCFYLDSPPPSLDQENTVKAIELMQLFINKNPASSRVADANEIIDKLRTKLETKSFLNARLYFDLEDYKAAIVSLQNSLKEFPDSHYREELSFYLLKSHYLLSVNSIPEKKVARFQQTLEQYRLFASAFPNSVWMKEANRMQNETRQFLNIQ